MATILFLLNKTRDSLVGLEYLVEVKNTNRLNYFCCVLCDLEFENHSNTVRHMVSFKHRVEYLKVHYPMTMKPALPLLQSPECIDNPSEWIVERVHFICNEIEKHFPRMNPLALSFDGLMAKRIKHRNGFGKKKKYNEDFVINTFRKEDVEHQMVLLDRSNVDFGGNQPQMTAVTDVGQPKQQRQPKPHSSAHCRSQVVDAQVIVEYHKRYSDMFAKVIENQKKYQKDPHSHPKYPAEWNVFWKERSREFDSAGKDPYDHDFTREWSLYWLERVKQLDIETIDRREKEIRLALNLPEDLDIPSLKQGRNQMFGHGPNNSDKPSNHSNKRSGQYNYQQNAKRSKQLYDPFEGLHDSDTDRRNTQGSPYQDPSVERHSDSDQRPLDTNFRQSSLESDYDQHLPSTSHQDEDNTTDPVSIISVLRLLAAFEDLLGNSLGPKVVDLLSKAVALEKVRPNLSDDLLVSEDNNVLLDTVKEKMKGLLLTGFVKTAQIPAVRKVIAHVNKINNIIELRVKANMQRAIKDARQNLGLAREKEKKEQELATIEFRKDVYQQLETSISLQGKQITPDQLETLTNVYIDKHTENDTPYLFGLQMGSRFPDLPRNGNNRFQGDQQSHGSNHEFGQMFTAQGNSRSSNDNNYPQMSTNFGRRDRDDGQNFNQFQDHSHTQSPNDNRRFGQNNYEQYNQDQFSDNIQQWPNSIRQNEFNDNQHPQQQTFSDHFGGNQQQQQFPVDFDQQHQQRPFNNGDIQQQDFQFNNNGPQFSDNGRQFYNNDNQFGNNDPNRNDFSFQNSRRRNRRPRNRAQNFMKNN